MMAKRFYCLVLSVLMLLSLVPVAALAAETAELPEVAEISTPTELTAPTLGAGSSSGNDAPIIDLTTLSIDAAEHEFRDTAVLRVKISNTSKIKSVYAFYSCESWHSRGGGNL